MAKTIAVANQKGGVGKTTTSVNLAACLAALQFRTLLVDIDPQGNATSGVGCDRASLGRSIYDALSGACELSDAVIPTTVELLSLAPASTDLAGAEVELVGVTDRERVLRAALASVAHDYDYVLIDCPPSLGLLTINALVAADTVLVPIQTEYYALEGLARLLDTIELVRRSLNGALALEGLVLTMHDGRNNLSRQVEAEVREHFAAQTYETVIPRNVRLSESPSFGQPIILYDIRSVGAKSYLDLAREFIERNASTHAQL
ncbi:MAG: ParA family protein [Myxococcales bacterium]|nr:ParA family protein [Myxococcales bacterium]MCB9532002.1 ParA family protein [Myxococcales bacterium]MCB9533852.1 ParA family protein [Myxococcales bacterium]